MSNLICIACGNRVYFETEVESVREIRIENDAAIVDNAIFDNWDLTENELRNNLDDTVIHATSLPASQLRQDFETNQCYNPLLFCGKCGSARVTQANSSWNPKKNTPLSQELIENRHEYKALRAERRSCENTLPVLWKPNALSTALMDSGDFPF